MSDDPGLLSFLDSWDYSYLEDNEIKDFFRFIQLDGDNRDQYINWNRLGDSICQKRHAVELLGEEVQDPLDEWEDISKELEKYGFQAGYESVQIMVKFQTFLNSVYALFENLAFTAYLLIPGLKRSFFQQQSDMDKLIQINKEYAGIVASADWYPDLNIMRSESTHFLDCLFFLNGERCLGIKYIDFVSRRKGVDKTTEIVIEDVVWYVNCIRDAISQYMVDLFAFFLTSFIKPDFVGYEPCYMKRKESHFLFLIGMKKVSFKNYLKGKPWTCMLDNQCPFSDCCTSIHNRKDEVVEPDCCVKFNNFEYMLVDPEIERILIVEGN